MTRTIEAVYESGVLKPLHPVDGLAEHDRVTVTIARSGEPHPFDGWVGGVSDEDAAIMRRVIEDELERRVRKDRPR